MNKIALFACISLAVCLAPVWAGEDIMPMHPGASYQSPAQTPRHTAARQASQLHVNQVRLRLPSSGPADGRMRMVEVNATRPDGSLDFTNARLVETDNMGIPGLISPETLAMDYNYNHTPYAEPEIARFSQEEALAPIEPLSAMAAPAPTFSREPGAVEMPPPISAVTLPIPPDGGRMYEEVPTFYSSARPVEAWSRPIVR